MGEITVQDKIYINGKSIQFLRRKRGFSQKELAQKITGYNRNKIKNLEFYTYKKVSCNIAEEFCKALDIPLQTILQKNIISTQIKFPSDEWNPPMDWLTPKVYSRKKESLCPNPKCEKPVVINKEMFCPACGYNMGYKDCYCKSTTITSDKPKFCFICGGKKYYS